MPSTRKKVIKTVYKDESEGETGDFSDSGSEAHISEPPTSDEEEIEEHRSSSDEFISKPNKTRQKKPIKKKPKFAKEFINKINKQALPEIEESDVLPLFSVKDLTDSDKLLPSVLNLSESDSSDDETPKLSSKEAVPMPCSIPEENEAENEEKGEYSDIWASNTPDDSEEIAKHTFMELEKHKASIEETKASLQSYVPKSSIDQTTESNVTDLLALGEDVTAQKKPVKTKRKGKKPKYDSDSEVEDWEEVKESKAIPQQGLQLVVALPDSVCRKSKKVDVEMMMKRKINRVKKEHQVFMHKVHVLCWIAHGNYVSPVLNDQEIMAAVLAMVPKGCYPESRLDMKYVEQITKWYKDKIKIKQDKNENKFRPKAPPLRSILLDQIKTRSVTAKKYMVFIFVAMLRALGLQCRIMFNFVTVPLRPPNSELCSLSTKSKDDKNKTGEIKVEKPKPKARKSVDNKAKSKVILPQVDGNYDSGSSSDDEFETSLDANYYGNNDDEIDFNELEELQDEVDDGYFNQLENLLNENEDANSCDLEKIIDENYDGDPDDLETFLDENYDANSCDVEKIIDEHYDGDPDDLETFLDENDDADPNELEKYLDENDFADSDDLEKVLYDHYDGHSDDLERFLDENDTDSNDFENTYSEYNYMETSRDDDYEDNDSEFEKIMQLDGNDDINKTRTMRTTRAKKSEVVKANNDKDEGVSPPKRLKKVADAKVNPASNNSDKKESSKSKQKNTIDKDKGDNGQTKAIIKKTNTPNTSKSSRSLSFKKPDTDNKPEAVEIHNLPEINKPSLRKTRINSKTDETDPTNLNNVNKKTASKSRTTNKTTSKTHNTKILNPRELLVTDENQKELTQSKYFESAKESIKRTNRKRSHTTIVHNGNQISELTFKDTKPKTRTKSAPGDNVEKSIYFNESESKNKKPKLSAQQLKKLEKIEDTKRVSHKDLIKPNAKSKNDVTGDLIDIMKGRIKNAKEEAKKGIVKGKVKQESDDDSDYLPVEDPKRRDSSDEDFKPTKISPKGPKISLGGKPSTSKKRIDRRVISTDDEASKSKIDEGKVDVWCEIFVEELEQWIAVDVVNGKVHCTGHLYKHATHPVCYVIGWDNNNYLKDLTRRYVPHWNTVTRKQRAEPEWWRGAVHTLLGPRNARDREEDEALDRMQLEAPLPTAIGEYKNHPLYALKRHLLKYEALYPPDARTLGFVRGEPVYARECVHVCRSRDTWLKEAKVVRMGEKPYKIVKARPKWDKLSNKLITDKPLEVFGPWQVQDYEPPTAENGVVPRNAYGNVELFKECMLPKGTVHVKLPGLNKVCRKLNIDCAPAMTGFDFNGGWSHPVYDGFVVCREFEEIVTDAWLKDQEEQERKEREKLDLRVYGNWKRLIKGLLIKQRLKFKYGFEEPTTSQPAKKKGPRFVAKKN